MSKFSDAIGEMVGTMLGLALGWSFCLVMLTGAYMLGYWAAPYLLTDTAISDGVIDRHTFGLLSAIVFIWLYEHKRTDDRMERLEKIARGE